MLEQLRPFFDHSRHTLDVRGVAAPLDVLAFDGDEGLSRTFAYRIEFTCASPDLTADALLGKDATFTLHPPPADLPMRGYIPPVQPPLRALHGVVSHFKRLSGSRDETRYEVLLEPRLALLERSGQYRIYQNQSVPEIVEQVLRNHGFRGQDFLFELTRTYLQREQVMQYGESDLAFIQRLLAEIGIWYGFSMDARLKIDVVQFHDDQRHYLPAPSLSLRPLSGLASGNQDGVWNLQTRHEVVQQQVSNRAYYYRAASAPLDAAADLARSPQTTYGEAYHYGEPHQTEGDAYARGDEEGHAESGHFYARLAHERYLNQRTQLSGTTSSAELLPGHLLNIDGAPQAFAPGAVIVRQHCRAARDRSFEAHFEAIPYSEQVCFRPMVPAKPVIAGSLPARVTSPQQNDPYGHIDNEGRYRVNFLFDRDAWDTGRESMWLRLARPYAGDTHGLHLPLLAGTEVAIAFEQGDPDRPYIAHALHDNLHPDPVTIQNYKRNVLRTPANNKIRLDDTRGQEHIKLSTEHSGKSQLNLGHLVDAQKQKRGEGFELRTDGHGAIRAGKGLFISADAQPQAQGQVLEMKAALLELQESLEQVRNMARDAALAMAQEPDKLAPEQLKAALDLLQQPGILASAPDGIALTSGEHLQLAAQNNLILNAGNQADISVVKRLFIGAGEGLGLFVRKLGMKLIANQGAVRIQAQNERMELQARKALNIVSTEGEIHITAKRKITFNAGGSYIRIDPYGIEYGTQGDYRIKAKYWGYLKTKAMQQPTLPALPLVLNEHPNSLALNLRDASAQAVAGAPYSITFETGQVLTGILNEQGHALHSPVPDSGARVQYQLPPPGPEQTWPPYEELLEAIAQVGPDAPR